MVANCRGNPPWLPILRAATGGGPYHILFGSGLIGLGFSNFQRFIVLRNHAFSGQENGYGDEYIQKSVIHTQKFALEHPWPVLKRSSLLLRSGIFG